MTKLGLLLPLLAGAAAGCVVDGVSATPASHEEPHPEQGRVLVNDALFASAAEREETSP